MTRPRSNTLLSDQLETDDDLLWSAVKRQQVADVRKYARECNVNGRDADGRTILEYLIVIDSHVPINQYEIVRILIQYGANPYIPSKNGRSAYAMATPRMKRFIERLYKN